MTGGLLDSGSILRAMRRKERKDAFRDEWTAFWSTRFGAVASCFLWALLLFAIIVLLLDWTGILPIVGGRN